MPDAITEPDLHSQRLQLAELIARFAEADGAHDTAIASLVLYRASTPSPITHTLYRPALCIMAQGQKVVRLENERYCYDPLHYLVASVTLPVTGEVTLAGPSAELAADSRVVEAYLGLGNKAH